MAPACFIGVVCTGNIHHIRRHGFTCGKRRNTCPCKHTQAHEQRHEQGERLFQCFHLVTSLKWPQKKHIALDVLLTAGFIYVLKKRGAPGLSHSSNNLPSVCEKQAGLLYSKPPYYIFFFRLFRLSGRGEVWRGETGKSRCFPANGRTSPL